MCGHLTYGLYACDLFKKLKHDADRLNIDEFDSKPDEFKYAFYDFVVTAYHLCDWVKEDNAIPISKKQIKQILDNNDIIKICRDLANASKHVTLNYTQVVSHADSPPDTPRIEITFKDSSGNEQKIDAIDFKNKF